MSAQSHSCDPNAKARQTRMFLCYGALSIALAVGFGYSMASIRHQEALVEFSKVSAKERASLHNRYMRQLGKKDKELAELRAIINKGVPK